MKTRLFNYLRFNRAERNGTLALLILAAIFFAIPEVVRLFRSPRTTNFTTFQQEIEAYRAAINPATTAPEPIAQRLFDFDPNTASQEDFVQLGLPEKVAKTICHYREKGGKFRSPADFQKIWSLSKADFERLLPYIQIGGAKTKTETQQPEKPKPECFPFDPNTASEADFKRLGLPDHTIRSILNYRAKGGTFRKQTDLEKIYTLSPEDFERITPCAQFPEQPIASAKPRPNTYSGGGAIFVSKKLEGPVDINRAGLEAWRTLPGIGETRARQLINFREKLGGFRSIEQVGELYGLPDSVFQAIKPNLLFIPSALRQINLNTASVEDLDAHPYITKRQAALIVAYREQHGPYTNPEDIGKMRAIADQVWLAKVLPYFSVN